MRRIENRMLPFVLSAALAALPALASRADAQSYDGCFVNGRQVSDSECQGGGGDSSGAANPMAGAMGNMGFALGAALGLALRKALTEPAAPSAPGAGAAPDPTVALKARQDQAWRRRQALDRAAAAREHEQFLAEQRYLLGDLRDLKDAANDGGAQPVLVRDPDKPREYPGFTGYTADEKRAHDENFMGTLYAGAGDWKQAQLSFQDALRDNPYGPFSDVIRDNLKLAQLHVAEAGQGGAPAAATGGGTAPNIVPAVAQSPPPLGKIVAAPPPTGAAAPAPAVQPAAAEFPPRVPPNTFAGCNSVYQQWMARRCQMGDGNVNGAECAAADAFMTKCVQHLGQDSWGSQ